MQFSNLCIKLIRTNRSECGLCGVIGDEKITFAMCHFANYLAELFPLRPPSAATGVPLPARSRMRARAFTIRYERNAAQASTLLTEIRAAGGRAESASADLAAPACQTGPRGSSCNG